MDSIPRVIRISTDDGNDMDWNVQSCQVAFKDALEVISQVLPGTAVTAFEYEDEDGDRITVRSQEDMEAMMSFHGTILSDCLSRGQLAPPLVVFPRVGKTVGMRNKFNLKVKTHSASNGTKKHHSKSQSAVMVVEDDPPPMEMDPLPPEEPMIIRSDKKPIEDIQNILAKGTISSANDLLLLEVLGTGNGGTVYRALHRPTGKLMAVKVIALDVSVEVQQQIISELDILHKCNSPQIIGFHHAFFIESRILMCTEYMDGGSLDKYGQIPEHILGRIAVAVVKGLQYLWGKKIMHRDVKPSNILVNTSGEVKLCDFGVSVQLEHSIAKSYVGTNSYMAPERLKGEDYSVHSEVWSLGVSLFEMATGRFPYEYRKPMELLNKVVTESPPKLPTGIFTDAFVHFTAQCMQKSPFSRPAPETLMEHPFIVNNDDGNMQSVALWVKSKLQAPS
ncbi:dual specificity mitogen-activated protein kinase kinase 5-like [Lineus longissimus]|uniref:dual specificity mitogen-activated protein kinase kinase 5-like n=1 Tax=Lineus longissimus TaxID=88925 RepID=UPI002B4CC16F